MPREPGELVIYSLAANSTGDIFCAVSPYKGAEGAKILQFDTSGKLKQYLRLVMPAFEDTRNRGDGRMLASHIGVAGNEIYVASSSSNKSRCAVYKVPVFR